MTTRALQASIDVGACSWLTTLPFKKYGFCLEKLSFWDSFYIRYNIPLTLIQSFCGAAFKLEHAVMSKR